MQKKSIFLKTALTLILIPILWTASCNSEKKYPVLQYHNFTAELSEYAKTGSFGVKDFKALRSKYGRFFDLWLYEIIDFEKFGPLSDTLKAEYLGEFISRNKPVFLAIEKHYSSYPDVQKKISDAFGRVGDLLGLTNTPEIYSYFSQFSNYNTFVDTGNGKTTLAFSSEMFMNDTFPLYQILEVPEFYNRYNNTEQIPAMLIWNYLKARYETDEGRTTMISEAVFNGKIWYTMAMVLGEDNLYKNLGYSEKEWNQMVSEEGQIWRYYLNENALFSSDFNKIKRYFTPGTHTFGSGIPADCPPLIGSFSGYRIVNAYMKKNNINLKQLWADNDANGILRKSGYNPLK